MSNPAKLKKQALQHEHDRQYDKALAIYGQLLDEPGEGVDEHDVALYNRAGDLALRVGDAARAVTYYERAVDLYAAGGLLNNAIALCNKILRHAPDRVSAHYSLGVLHAKQGFRGDAKYHFVEYAERMHRAGRDDEALRALREFAELCEPGDDARALLAHHLTRAGKGSQAAATLQAVFDASVPPARPQPAEPAPEAAPGGASRGSAARLVFLDLNGDAAPEADEDVDEPAPVAGLDVLEPAPDGAGWGTAPSIVDGFEGTSWDDAPAPGMVEVDVPRAVRAPVHASALPGELPMLELPLPPAWAAPGAPATLLEPVAATDLVLDLEAGAPPELVLLDAPPAPASAPASAPAAAQAAAESLALLDLAVEEPEPETPLASAPPVAEPLPVAPAGPAASAVAATDDGLDLGDWLREVEAPRSTRMVTAEPSQTGDEQADFERMLDAFKAGVERNIDGEDYESHYDLGVAFREMGLLDEAVTQFQRASRAPGRPLRALEALGQCFVDLGQPELALEALRRAVAEPGPGAPPLADEQLVGVLYLLGVASELTGQGDAAAAYFRRVLAIDIRFRDAATRLAQLPPPTR